MQIFETLTKRPFAQVALIVVLIILGVLPFLGADYLVVTFADIFVYTILTLCYVMFSGPTGYISLASAAFFGVGVYSMAMLQAALPLPLVILIGGIVSCCLALLVGAVTLRLRGIYFSIFSFGLIMFIMNFLLWWEVNMTHTVGRVIRPVGNNVVYYVLLLILVVTSIVLFLVRRSRYGMALQAIGDNEEAASHVGINVTKQKIMFFVLSAFFMGAAGAIMATRWTYIDPRIAFNSSYSFLPVLMASFGGMGLMVGPIFGATFLTYLEEFLLTRFPNLYMLIFGLILVVVVVFMPYGLVGFVQQLRKEGGLVRKRATT